MQLFGIIGTVTVLSSAAYILVGAELLLHRALSFRPEIWSEFVSRTIERSIWFGNGMTTESEFQLSGLLIQHPHSVLVSTFYYGGLTGLVLYIGLIFKVASALNVMENQNVRLLGLMLIAFGQTATFFDGDELISKVNYLWLIIWLPVGLAITPRRNRLV